MILERLKSDKLDSLNPVPIPLQAGGHLASPLGLERLRVVQVLKEIVRTRKPGIIQALCQSKLLAGCVALCREHQWNNCLHNTVHLIFEYLLDTSLVDRDLKLQIVDSAMVCTQLATFDHDQVFKFES